jgi:NAD(P)-dependent dehydrogenase (short-subunit alcohol dehydrogenase family)
MEFVRPMKPPVIVVTGANRGIGFEIVRQLVARDAQVVLTARSDEAGQKAIERLRGAKTPPQFHRLDVTDDQSARSLAAFLEQTFGRCDVLINNAGMIANGDDSILKISPDLIRTTLETNTLGPLRVAQALLPLLRKSERGGRIVNMSSGAGELSDFDGSWSPAYSFSKAALNLITRMLAPACAKDGIAVNSMCPGWVRTDMGGPSAPRDVTQGADTAVWLALDAPAKLTGKFLRDRKEIAW